MNAGTKEVPLSSILDGKGFLIPRDREAPDRHHEVTIRGPLDELRMLATLVDLYYAGNPAVDNDEVRLPARDLGVAANALVQQLRDQGVEVLDWDTDGVEQPVRLDPQALATAFLARLRGELGANWHHMTRMNREDPEARSGGVCHSHDFCDANQVMLDAAADLLGRETRLGELGGLTGTFNEAWSLAAARLRGE